MRSLVLPWGGGLSYFQFGVMVPVVSKIGEEERLINGVIKFRFAPAFPCCDVFLRGIWIDAPFPGKIAAVFIGVGHDGVVEVGAGKNQRAAGPRRVVHALGAACAIAA